ncbi:MAG: hypothetical protein ACTS2F_22890 [Thainema sp.]
MERSRGKIRCSLGQRVDQEFESIVYRVMTNNGLEETVNYAVQKALVELVNRKEYLSWQ